MAAYRLTFRLPAALVLMAQPGRHQPCLHGCVLTVDRAGGVAIEGPSRERVFEQAGRFLKILAKGRPPMTIAAVLVSLPAPPGRGGRDTWSITLGAEVAFAATSIEPTIPDVA